MLQLMQLSIISCKFNFLDYVIHIGVFFIENASTLAVATVAVLITTVSRPVATESI